ncbi:helix-turn-helix transcriptional regulator [Calidifontibacillus erzurumensis]|nr:metalloregulator ArsR/SmtB family transcription factor [Calidifontibacillus erzurumensis]
MVILMTGNGSSTRDEILTMLKLNKRMTVTEMANQLQITEMAVRRHLNTLEKDRYVETVLVRQAMGRPLNIYQLSEAGEELFPRNYKKFVLDFIADIEELCGKEMVETLFERRKNRMKEALQKKLNDKPFEERVEELARIQKENGYMAEIEKNEDGSFQLSEHNCPIALVANKYKAACHQELELFKEVLGTDNIERFACLSDGDAACQYRIKK